MKRIIMTILAAAVCLAAEAQQWDSLYYRPDRHVVPVEDITCRRGMELLGGDSLDVIETVAESKHAGIVYIYHGNAENITGKLDYCISGYTYQNIVGCFSRNKSISFNKEQIHC